MYSVQQNADLGVSAGHVVADRLAVAIEALAEENARMALLIEKRYFGGMTAEVSAGALGMPVHVVRHDLRFGQPWLRRRLAGE